MTRKEFLHWLGVFGLAQSAGMLTWACESQVSRPENKASQIGKGKKALVIGAGIAGIAAARNLQDAGFEVEVIEARDRIGGRIWTDHSLGTSIDMGASWIHGANGNPITALTKKYKIKTATSRRWQVKLYNPNFSILSDKALRQKREMAYWFYRRAYRLAYFQNKDAAMADMLERLMKEYNLDKSDKNYLRWRLRVSELSEGASLHDLSTWYDASKRFRGSQLVFPQGYDQVVKKLAQGIPIKLGQVVNRIDWDRQKVKVTTKQSNVFEGDFAVITLPLGVLKRGAIVFNPALPSYKQKAINSLGMGLLNKVVLKFDDFFWDKKLQFMSHLAPRTDPYFMYMNWGYFSQKPILIATVAGKFGKVLEEENIEVTKKQVLYTLNHMFGKTSNLLAIKTTHWWTDPHSLGSYSHLPLGVKATQFNALSKPVDNLFFAGEATHQAYLATVHGAFLSGKRAAKEIIRKY